MFSIKLIILYIVLILDWYAMAQLAAQDYFTRLQATGLSQMPFHPDMASFAGMAGMGQLGGSGSGGGGGKASSNSSAGSSSKKKEDKQSNANHYRQQQQNNHSSIRGQRDSGRDSERSSNSSAHSSNYNKVNTSNFVIKY